MKILVSNDDGYRAPGIICLANALSVEHQVTVVAPDRDRSGASNALTLHMPLRVEADGTDRYSVDGTPTDCVHLGLTGLLENEPDMVVSGINAGPNLGDDVLYSGTVAAAMEGRFLGRPAIAVSLAAWPQSHFETAARVASELVMRLREAPVPADTILNVNVPDLPWNELQGFRATRLGHRHRSEPVIRQTDPRGRPIYWVGMVGQEQDAGEGTDFHAVREGYVSVTPLKVDLTRHDMVTAVSDWLEMR
jgi:5'-nucleotidase